MENTLQNKATFFAQYWGQRVMAVTVNEDQSRYKVGNSHMGKYHVECCQLELLHVEKITDQDAEGMFVPCDENGNVLAEPKMKVVKIGFDEEDVSWDIDEVEIYRAAKEKVLFKGFELKSETKDSWIFKINGQFPFIIYKRNRIEILLIYNSEIELTESAIKNLGL